MNITDDRINSKEYEEFVKKFETIKYTDYCYTPAETYEAILVWVKDNTDIEVLYILRHFYHGGNYELEKYTENTVVIDNPPFYIVSKIVDFYERNNIKYFLFTNGLTVFNVLKASTHIVCNSNIIYHNGADVNTNFVSNLFGNKKVIGSRSLYEAIK